MKRWILLVVAVVVLFVGMVVPAVAPGHRTLDDSGNATVVQTPAPGTTDLADTAKLDQTGYIKGLYISYSGLGSDKLRDHVKQLLETTELNAIVIDFKGDRGFLTFPTEVERAKEIGADTEVMLDDPAEFMQWLKAHKVYTIARIVVFKDNLLSKAHPEWAVTDSYTGGVWKDAEGLGWADPNYHAVWDYNVALAIEAAEMGFDEVQFDYVRFPTDGSIKRATFAQENTQENRVAAITGLLKRAQAALKPYGVRLAADIFGYTSWVEDDMGIGQHIESIAPYVDVLSPMVYPSTFSYGLPGESPDYRNAVAYPYGIVNRSMQRAITRATAVNPNIQVRPWLQDFQDYAFDGRTYTPYEIRQQMDGARDAGGRGWLLWDPAVVYTPEALVSAKPAYPPNTLGSVLVLEYGRIAEPGDGPQSARVGLSRSPADFRADLERLLAGGYYPVNLREMAESRLAVVPAGKRPVVLTFDGATTDQFRLLPNGTVDPNSAVGILQAFHEAHFADWPLRATFFVPPASGEQGEGPFGPLDLSARKLAMLVAWGMEVGAETTGRTDLSKISPNEVQQELASAQARLEEWLPDYDIVSLRVVNGGYPKDESLLVQGQSNGQAYAYKAVVGPVRGLATSPRSPKFNPYRIPRIQADGSELERSLRTADRLGVYYVSAGE